MAWTAPRTYTVGEIITKVILDAHVRDNLRYLKGLDGVPTIEAGLVIDNTDGDEYLLLPLLSTAECTSVLNAEGEHAFDEQTHRLKLYNGSAIGSAVTTLDVDDTPADGADTDPISSNWAYDHVAAADPHTGYLLESLADAQADILYATGDNAWTRLAKGTAGQIIRMNAGETAPEWATGVATKEFFVPFGKSAAGTYTSFGDFSVMRLQATQSVFFSFKCPHDFTTLTHCKVVGQKGGTENIDWTVTTDFAAAGEAYNTHSDTDTADAVAMTDTEIETIDISAAFTGLLADDYVGVLFVLDTAAAGVYDVIGLEFLYT